MARRFQYDLATLHRALVTVGVQKGDLVFSHVGPGFLGPPSHDASEREVWEMIVEAFTSVLGSTGTLVIPTYTYSYTIPGEVYDPASTPSKVGAFTEYFRSLPKVTRSVDPIFSVAALGATAEKLITDIPRDCFGEDSIYGRLKRAGGKLCNIGVGFRYATYVHHVEQRLRVPYRFPKYFTGFTVIDGQRSVETWKYFVRDLEDPAGLPDLRRLEGEARARNAVRSANVGMGQVTCIALETFDELCGEGVRLDPWFLARGGSIEYAGPRTDHSARVERGETLLSAE